jgi:hypothetical protein
MKLSTILLAAVLATTVTLAAVSHTATQITPGQFANGSYSFQQNVGIGTSTPGARLGVLGAKTSDASMSYEMTVWDSTAYNSNPVAGILFLTKVDSVPNYAGMGGISVGKSSTGADTASYLALHTRAAGGNVAERLRVDSSGNVGIGATTLGGRLVVNNSAASQVGIVINRNSNSNGYANIRFDTGGDSKFYVGLDKDLTPNSDKLSFYEVASGLTIMTIVDGKVGIGTVSPGNKMSFGAGIASNLSMKDQGSFNFYIDPSVPYQRDFDMIAQGDTDLNNYGGAQIRFFTTPGDYPNVAAIQRMVIDRNGYVGIGTTSPNAPLEVKGSDHILRLTGGSTGASNVAYMTFYDSGGTRKGYIGDASAGDSNMYLIADAGAIVIGNLNLGYVCSSSAGVLSYGSSCTTSSIRYKKNIRNLELDSSKVFQLKPVSFDWKETNKTDFGLIAEDVERIYPQLISYNKDGQPEAMRYDVMSVLLLEQMRLLKSQNDALTTENVQIKQRLDALEAKVK